jgi:hypothetical protein
MENGYEDVAALVERAIASIQAKGKKSRRNWWDILAGGKDGRPRVREGIEFPVLQAAQRRQKRPITENAIARNPDEEPPPAVDQARWRS